MDTINVSCTHMTVHELDLVMSMAAKRQHRQISTLLAINIQCTWQYFSYSLFQILKTRQSYPHLTSLRSALRPWNFDKRRSGSITRWNSTFPNLVPALCRPLKCQHRCILNYLHWSLGSWHRMLPHCWPTKFLPCNLCALPKTKRASAPLLHHSKTI